LRAICFAQPIFIAGFIRLAFLADTAHGQASGPAECLFEVEFQAKIEQTGVHRSGF